MHNGEVHGFKKIRRSLLATLRDDLFEHISGTTDSEVLFRAGFESVTGYEFESIARDDGARAEGSDVSDYPSERREVELDEFGVYGWGDGRRRAV